MRYTTVRRFAHSAIVAALPCFSTLASAQAPVAEPPPAPEPPPTTDLRLDFGVGLRTEFVIDPDNNDEDGDSPVYSFNSNLRPYIAGQVHRFIKFEGNLDTAGTDVFLLDAVLKLEFNDYFNLWAGRFLPPSDRANLSGPYFQNAWTYPDGVHGYPAVYAGRDDGLAAWGQINGGQFKYQVGFFGMQDTPDPRFAARLVYNVFDPEPGYYNSSTYFGTKRLLAFGAVLQHHPAPDGAPDAAANTLWSLDALFEDNIGDGTLDVEGAFYGFGGADAGTSFFLLASYLFGGQVGIGQLQPMLRFQRAMWSDGDAFQGIPAPLDEDASMTTIDGALHYVINGHNARLAATIRHRTVSVGDAPDVDDTTLILGGQVQAF